MRHQRRGPVSGASERWGFYRPFEQGIRCFGYRVHAFCLMSNPVHLALQMRPSRCPRELARKGIELFGFSDRARTYFESKSSRGLERFAVFCQFMADLSRCTDYHPERTVSVCGQPNRAGLSVYIQLSIIAA